MKEKCGEQKPFKCISKGKIGIFELENFSIKCSIYRTLHFEKLR